MLACRLYAAKPMPVEDPDGDVGNFTSMRDLRRSAASLLRWRARDFLAAGMMHQRATTSRWRQLLVRRDEILVGWPTGGRA